MTDRQTDNRRTQHRVISATVNTIGKKHFKSAFGLSNACEVGTQTEINFNKTSNEHSEMY